MNALAFFLITAFALGAIIGSFLNVVIYRVPRGLSVAHPKRSFCPQCRRQIPWNENLPIVSYVIQNGCCRGCGKSIPWTYVMVEVVTALVFAVLTAWSLDAQGRLPIDRVLPLLSQLVLAALLVAITVIDFKHALIPDPLTVPWIPGFVALAAFATDVLRGHRLDSFVHGDGVAMPAALFAGLFIGVFPALVIDWWTHDRSGDDVDPDGPNALPTDDEEFSLVAEMKFLAWPVLVPAALGAAALGALVVFDVLPRADAPGLAAALASAAGAGFGLFLVFAVRFVFSALFQREAMGLGDAKFLALAGAVFGAEGALLVFLLASVLGALPAFFTLFRRMPIATFVLLGTASLMWIAPLPLARALGSEIAALALIVPLPLIALFWFLRRLRSSEQPLAAMPFGPFLAVATLVLLLFRDELAGVYPLHFLLH
ncbi:MAG: prepilin peptidase [Planctomycetes bacterium]|nr:prepilin peptidase [Planctomycetota bacterium]MCC7170872.1 prepilin peptidase [Planctomycetota bacterium]